ncbi:pyridine nucleotide-disulfide oxidoreductase [Streptomyces zinciresistens K42]|uniref:Pyridine nucleotide-disulfide oxidoreductase n=1 Tax=Streptomyces zinciresistens K42 TaxID=700597 RepID=G2GGM4_9ACTN|nr:FAD-dependent oxidoreductase [Streptomyces zinciresistens]EGX57319.1 pyridine nucleotide-disulfide oxidoreductase [Streptomyces zinciresistens K42]
MTATPHHVVVGGSAAGAAAALSMRASGFQGRITLVDADVYEPYERPPLSKTFEDLAAPRPIVPPGHYADQDIQLALGARAVRLDDRRRRVVLDTGDELPADAVLLATGVSPRRLGVPGEDLGNILSLRDIHDARALAARLDAGGGLLIVGGGFIGLEAAAVARGRGLDVTVVEARPVPLAAVLDTGPARVLNRTHTERGVRFRTGRTVARFRGDGVVEEAVLDDGTRCAAATVLVGCGVTPNDGLARAAGARTDDGIVTDARGRTSHPWLWAAGDVASYVSPYTVRRGRIEHWDVARRHGTAVGATMAGRPASHSDAPYFWSDQYGRRLQMYGRRAPGDRLVTRPGSTEDGFLAFWLRDGRLVAAAGLDRPRELRAAKPLIECRARVTPEDLADPAVPLRGLGGL